MKYLNTTAFLISAVLMLSGCEKEGRDKLKLNRSVNSHSSIMPFHCQPGDPCANLIYQKGGETFLWAGKDTSTHFNITNWNLNAGDLRSHGLTRESFPALITPEYTSIQDIPDLYSPEEPVILVKGKSRQLVYPYSLMTFHEVINDEIDGEPIMVCYCVLADFPGVYSRKVCGKTLTYAVSGYTYYYDNPVDPQGRTQAFVLWDRNTESLYFPINNLGVSHTMNGIGMMPFTQSKWEVSTMKEVRNRYPDAEVLKHGQSFRLPAPIPLLDCQDLSCCHS